MGTNALQTRRNSTVILTTWFNIIRAVILGDWYPRTSGALTSNAGSLGTATYPWLKAEISSGHFSVGAIKMHHSYNGAAPIGHGWMLCDGRIITEANYNTEHGASTWATYVGASSLLNKYLPNMTSRYLVGAATTTATGASAIPTAGNYGNTINYAHTHGVPPHNHQWYNTTSYPGVVNIMYDNVGGEAVLYGSTGYTYKGIAGENTTAHYQIDNNQYTSNDTLSDNSSGSTTQDVQPESITIQYYMKVA